MAFWRLHYHVIWPCKNRQPLITAELEPRLFAYLMDKGLELGAIMHAVGGIEDHVHSAFSLHPKFSVAEFIGNLKGASSHWVTHVLKHPRPFDWQRGYGLLSFGSKHLPQIIKYVRHQKYHHDSQTTHAVMERWSEEDDGVVMYWEGANSQFPPRGRR